MALGEIEMSKTRRTYTISGYGFLFFLLFQMSLFSKVWPTVTVVASTDTSQTVSPESSSSSASTYQVTSVVASSSHASGSTDSNTGSTSVHMTVSTMGITAPTDNSSSVTGNHSTYSNHSALSCPAFVCTTDCYGQLMNATANPCPSSSFCEIMKQNGSYSVNCSASCGAPCGNTTIVNCSWKCCNTTNCVNDTLLALTNSLNSTAMSSVAPTTSTSTMMSTKSTAPSTQATNGKKCHAVKCDGAACYKGSNNPVMCAVGQDYCMLKKTTSTTGESWQAGCSDDCRKMAVCSGTATACYLECCNATTTSCLKMTGDVNMPSSATRGPHSPALLLASLLLLWIVRVFT